MRCFVHMVGLTRYAAVVIRAYYFVCAKFLVRTRALIPACRFSVVPVVLWSCRAYMFLTRAKYSAYLLSASSRAVDLSLSFVCVLWEPDPSLEPMGVLHRNSLLLFGKLPMHLTATYTALPVLRCKAWFASTLC